MEERKRITFLLRVIHNLIKLSIHKTGPDVKKGPKTQLQGGILGYLCHHRDQPVYQKDLEKEFRISGATVSNTLQVMEREGLIRPVPGKGFYVCEYNTDYLREKQLMMLEKRLGELVGDARAAGLTCEELKEMVDAQWNV